jgi:hypothetical protein
MYPMQRSVRRFTPVFALFLGLGLFTAETASAAQCKGKMPSDCQAAAECTWVDSYTTKKGTEVSAYCRTKTRKSADKPTPQQSTSSKDGQEPVASPPVSQNEKNIRGQWKAEKITS